MTRLQWLAMGKKKNKVLSEEICFWFLKNKFSIFFCNQTVGDAMSDLLAVEAILHLKKWNLKNWSKIYTELPNRQLKVKVSSNIRVFTFEFLSEFSLSKKYHLNVFV